MWRLRVVTLLFTVSLAACSGGGNDFPENPPPPSDSGTPPADSGTTTEPTTNTDNTGGGTATDPQAGGGETTGGGGGGGGGNNCHQHGNGNNNHNDDDDDDEEEDDDRHNPCRGLALNASTGLQVFGAARGMDIAGNAAGDGVAIWHDGGRVLVARLTKAGWSAPLVVAANADAVAVSQARVAEDGSATLRWAYTLAPNSYFERRIAPDNTLSNIEPVAASATLWPTASEARDGNRSARVTQHADGSIAVEIYEPATGWGAPRVVAVGVPGTARLSFAGATLLLGYVRAMGGTQEAVLQAF